jgi:hypothetical protein
MNLKPRHECIGTSVVALTDEQLPPLVKLNAHCGQLAPRFRSLFQRRHLHLGAA